MMPFNWSSSDMTSGANMMPRMDRRTKPFARMLSTFLATVSMGIARPTPANVPLPVRIAVLMPMTFPSLFINGPPLFPGLMEASVWMTPLIGRPPAPSILRETPLMMPRLKLCSKPNGLPKAKTFWPTRRLADVARSNGTMSPGGSGWPDSTDFAPTRRTATSLAGSMPMTTESIVVRRSFPSLSFVTNVTNGASVPCNTWKFVTTQSLSHTNPLPVIEEAARSLLSPRAA
mmetsp:Transcript_15158/g.41734  ORF Transcript_15158/g.41734 Transcript_15158/m.41734 type:complete len:231 (-) Transcript_15158:139-831(-)